MGSWQTTAFIKKIKSAPKLKKTCTLFVYKHILFRKSIIPEISEISENIFFTILSYELYFGSLI